MSKRRFALATVITISIISLVMFFLIRFTGQYIRPSINIFVCIFVGIVTVIALIINYKKYVK